MSRVICGTNWKRFTKSYAPPFLRTVLNTFFLKDTKYCVRWRGIPKHFLCQRSRIGRISREEMTSTYRRYPMAEATLEERVATLEQLVAQLMNISEREVREKDWRHKFGM